MSEEILETGSESDETSGANAAALTFALDGASRDPRLNKAIESFLARQETLLAKQSHHLDEQMKKLGLSLIDQRLTMALKILTVLVGLMITGGFSWMVYDAAHDHGLVIDAFSVPPDLAARGLTGQAVAAQLLDRLQAMQDATDSARPPDSYANNWGDEIKVEIPSTGVSIGEFRRLLVSWLGHQTHITGEVWHSGDGLAITARASGEGGATVTGKEADFTGLLEQAAERIFERTQPYRYSSYLAHDGYYPDGDGPQRLARSLAIFQRQAVEGANARERNWAALGIATDALYAADMPRALTEYRQVTAMVPDFVLAWVDIQGIEAVLEHQEQSLRAARVTVRLLERGDADMTATAAGIALVNLRGGIAYQTGDFGAAVAQNAIAAAMPDYSGLAEQSREYAAISLGFRHEPAAARAAWQSLPAVPAGDDDARASARPQFDHVVEDWTAVLSDRAAAEAALQRTPNRNQVPQLIWPYVADAMAHTGDVAGAEALLAKTPLDCDACVVARGDVAALKRDWKSVDRWFALVSARTPSIPFADTQWGLALLQKRDFAGAVAHFAEAHKRGPHFADPLEYWGEALVAQNRSDLALSKFTEAAQFAPNWGRLHLKWGEALLWSGRKDEAVRQFAAAAKLDLTPTERAQLAQISHG